MKVWVFCGAILCAALAVAGCAPVKEGIRGFAGISTKVLGDKRAQAIVKIYPCGYDAASAAIETMLTDIGAYVYARDAAKHLIAFYVNEINTTPIGIFLTRVDEMRTKVEVSSPGVSAKEYIAARLDEVFSKEPSAVEETPAAEVKASPEVKESSAAQETPEGKTQKEPAGSSGQEGEVKG